MSIGERGCKGLPVHQESDGIEVVSMASFPEDLMLSGDFRGKFKKIRSRKRPTILAWASFPPYIRILTYQMPLSWLSSHTQAEDDTSDVGLFKVNLPRECEREREGGLERRTRRGGELSGSVALCSGSVSGGSITLP
ncbi:unnamed protein product [Leuciscus chuanchicus]